MIDGSRLYKIRRWTLVSETARCCAYCIYDVSRTGKYPSHMEQRALSNQCGQSLRTELIEPPQARVVAASYTFANGHLALAYSYCRIVIFVGKNDSLWAFTIFFQVTDYDKFIQVVQIFVICVNGYAGDEAEHSLQCSESRQRGYDLLYNDNFRWQCHDTVTTSCCKTEGPTAWSVLESENLIADLFGNCVRFFPLRSLR